MRIIVMFDLPSVTKTEMKNYRNWHKFLIKSGFQMMTESVYSRLVLNPTIGARVKNAIRCHLPPKGIVQMFELTEKQYANIEYCLGESDDNLIDTIERYVEIE